MEKTTGTMALGLITCQNEGVRDTFLEVDTGDSDGFIGTYSVLDEQLIEVVVDFEAPERFVKLLEALDGFGDNNESIGLGVLRVAQAAFRLGQQHPDVILS